MARSWDDIALLLHVLKFYSISDSNGWTTNNVKGPKRFSDLSCPVFTVQAFQIFIITSLVSCLPPPAPNHKHAYSKFGDIWNQKEPDLILTECFGIRKQL